MELTLDQALQKGVEAHRAGQVQEADRLYTAVLQAQPKHPDANHNMGVLAVGIGKVQDALPFFKTALQANSNANQFWLSYIDALIRLEQLAAAKTVFDQAKENGVKGDTLDKLEQLLHGKRQTGSIVSNSQDPPQDRLQPLVNLYTQGKLKQALVEMSKLLKQFPKSVVLYNICGAANAGLGFLDDAVESYKKALSIKPDYAEAYNNIGVVLKDQGKLREAIEAYDKALSIKPDYAETFNNMGNALTERGKLNEAIEACKKALSFKPDNAEAHVNMGNALKKQGKLDKAIEAYTKALSIKPNYAKAWVNGAEALEKWNKLEQLEVWLEKAFQAFETVPSDLWFIRSKLLWRNKKFKEASNLISDIDFETITQVHKTDYLNLKAKCYEKNNNFDYAFDWFSKSNSLAKKSSDYLKYNPENYFQNLRVKLKKLKSGHLQKPIVHLSEKTEFNPVFLVGFPRSGTTLLDTILRSHSKIEVVEEQPTLTNAKLFLQKNGYNDLEGNILPAELLAEAKAVYKAEFNKHIVEAHTGSVCIDKLPLNLLQVPWIQQLYPQAKFILALRHPMDTVLSCWMQNFKLNPATANMVDLERVVEFYCIAMDTFKICRAKYNLSVHEIRYEDLLEDLSGETSALLKFLDNKLDWEPQMKNYQETALKRGRIATPSYSQVVQPIYKDAKYRWLNYEKYLKKYLNQINPWIGEFGYSKY